MVAELERDVEARSAGLKKELGLFDLVLSSGRFCRRDVLGWLGREAWLRTGDVLDPRDRDFLFAACSRRHLSQSSGAARRWSLPVGQDCLQRLRRLHGRLELVGVCHHDSRRYRVSRNNEHLVRYRRKLDARARLDHHYH